MEIERKLPEIRVGANVLIQENGKILLLKRKGGFGEGTWCFPGGHFEEDMNIIQAAMREADEEVGIQIEQEHLRFITTSDKRQGDMVHIQFLYEVIFYTGTIINKEPNESSEIGFFGLDNLPGDIFPPHRPLIDYLQKK